MCGVLEHQASFNGHLVCVPYLFVMLETTEMLGTALLRPYSYLAVQCVAMESQILLLVRSRQN